MKKLLLLATILFGIGAVTVFIQYETALPEPAPTKEETRPLFDRVTIDLADTTLRMYAKNSSGDYYRTIANLKHSLEGQGTELLFATNGGIFMENLTPLGLYIEEGEIKREMNTVKDAYGNFYLQPNGVFYLQDGTGGVVETDGFTSIQDVQYATQSGPMLLLNGEINPAFDQASQNERIRSGVCFPTPTNVTFIISNRPVTFHTFAEEFLESGCIDALYLDGVISDMYAPEINRTPFGLEYGIIIGATNP
jgi:uncharacterized protein YigE (DUF2233 family)